MFVLFKSCAKVGLVVNQSLVLKCIHRIVVFKLYTFLINKICIILRVLIIAQAFFGFRFWIEIQNRNQIRNFSIFKTETEPLFSTKFLIRFASWSKSNNAHP